MSATIRALRPEGEGDPNRSRALLDIDDALASESELRRVLTAMLDRTAYLVPAIAASTVRLLNEESGKFDPMICHNLDEQEWKAATNGTDGRFGPILEEEEPAVMVLDACEDRRTSAPQFLRKHGLTGYLRIRLAAKGKTLGAITFFTRKADGFDQADIEFLTQIGRQGAIAVENARLYEQTKKQAAELERRNAELERAIGVREKFLGLMSHELRTPLTITMGYTQMVKDGMCGDINAKQEDAMRKILIHSKGQLDMINNILTATAFESGKIALNREVVVLPELLNEVLSIYYDLSIRKGVEISLHCPAEFPLLETDAVKLRQVLHNLISNALKFTETGAVNCAIHHIPQAHRVELKVTDTGIGIPSEQLSLIFGKFHQVDSSDVRLHGGVGLGLYISRQFVRLLGGEITVESEPGKGSTFTVTLPCER